jgi:hypothetical protein
LALAPQILSLEDQSQLLKEMAHKIHRLLHFTAVHHLLFWLLWVMGQWAIVVVLVLQLLLVVLHAWALRLSAHNLLVPNL